MQPDKLIIMANQIVTYFGTQPGRESGGAYQRFPGAPLRATTGQKFGQRWRGPRASGAARDGPYPCPERLAKLASKDATRHPIAERTPRSHAAHELMLGNGRTRR